MSSSVPSPPFTHSSQTSALPPMARSLQRRSRQRFFSRSTGVLCLSCKTGWAILLVTLPVLLQALVMNGNQHHQETLRKRVGGMVPLSSNTHTPQPTGSSSSSSSSGGSLGDWAPVRPYRPPLLLPLTATSQKTTPPTEFELGVGRALDTLRRDYPLLLVSHPDYSIYSRDISVIDPTGVHIHGLTAYKNAFRLVHAIVKLVYCIDRSTLHFKMCYDTARQSIRVHWNARVVPREIFGGARTTLHVDGISVYELDAQTANVTEHRIEQLLINQTPVVHKDGLIAALRDTHDGVAVSVPSFFTFNHRHYGNYKRSNDINIPVAPMVLEYQSHPTNWKTLSKPSSLLFACESTNDESHSAPSPSSSSSSSLSSNSLSTTAAKITASTAPTTSAVSQPATTTSKSSQMDWDKFRKKNKSRQKFGLKPLSVEEFLQLEEQVAVLAAKQLDQQQQQQQQMLSSASSSESQSSSSISSSSSSSILDKIFRNNPLMENTCENHWDCERPLFCCEMGWKKMCCASGTPVGASAAAQYAYVPVPVDVNTDPKNLR